MHHPSAHDPVAPQQPAPQRLCYLHIMKTGGTSLMRSLVDRFERRRPGSTASGVFVDEFVAMPTGTSADLDLIAGHLPFEIASLLPEDTITMTVLRDPVERTISHYWHIRSDPLVRAEDPDLTLSRFLTSRRWSAQANNYQARQLAHHVGIVDAGVTFDPATRFAELGPPFPTTHPLPLQSLFDCGPLELDPSDLFDRAARNLTAIDIVGTTDRLDDVLRAATLRCGLIDDGPAAYDNVAVDRPSRSHVGPELVAQIERRNTVDRALYEIARRFLVVPS